LLWIILLASILCMALRSLLLMDAVGILIWPVLLGFGTGRMVGGHGVWGGTIAGFLSFLSTALLLSWGVVSSSFWSSAPWTFSPLIVAVGAGICWGFYLSIWAYIVVETILQWL
jgi:hypothetical protein